MSKNFKIIKLRITSITLTFIIMLFTALIPANAETRKVIIGGEAFGLKLYCKGVMIIKLENFECNGKSVCPAEKSGLKTNDTITTINGKTVKTNEQVSSAVKNSGGKALSLNFIRDNQNMSAKLIPQKNGRGEYKAGMWVRDSCAGLGTVSYYDTSSDSYGALGHGICDIDSGGLIKSSSGEILKANITSVTKSENNNIGTLNGYFTDDSIGSVNANTPLGIYGKLTNYPNKKAVDIAYISEVEKGSATLYTTVNGQKPKAYEIEIVSIINTQKSSNRNIIIKIKDKKLINAAGGIVQGMSGSPIIQNGKFAAALTHVFLDDCTSGYAVFAENMVTS